MRPTFHPRMVNGPFGDPAVLIRILGRSRNLFFDLGELHTLSAKSVLRATHAFISHAHLDHFCGFDTVLRYGLGRDRVFRVVGPARIADRVEGKLRGYTWNLVHHYSEAFTVEVLECTKDGTQLWTFPCREGFVRREAPSPEGLSRLTENIRVVHRESSFRVTATELDHMVPSMAYAIEESRHINICADALQRMDLSPGPWLRRLKESLYAGEPPDTPIPVPERVPIPLGRFLETGAIRVTEGQKLAYVADCLWGEPGIARAIELVRGSHLLYCEAAFLDADGDRARRRYHLTAAQAGELARRAKATALRIFHFSPKYRGREKELVAEARESFGGPVSIAP